MTLSIESIEKIKNTLTHARKFISTKQKMANKYIIEFDGVVGRLNSLHEAMLNQCKKNHKMFGDKDELCNICGKPLNKDY